MDRMYSFLFFPYKITPPDFKVRLNASCPAECSFPSAAFLFFAHLRDDGAQSGVGHQGLSRPRSGAALRAHVMPFTHAARQKQEKAGETLALSWRRLTERRKSGRQGEFYLPDVRLFL